jgi:hypothetical protein
MREKDDPNAFERLGQVLSPDGDCDCSQGLSTGTAIGSKSARLRVAMISPWTRAVAAINESRYGLESGT